MAISSHRLSLAFDTHGRVSNPLYSICEDSNRAVILAMMATSMRLHSVIIALDGLLAHVIVRPLSGSTCIYELRY
jgi:hypothetical protein